MLTPNTRTSFVEIGQFHSVSVSGDVITFHFVEVTHNLNCQDGSSLNVSWFSVKVWRRGVHFFLPISSILLSLSLHCYLVCAYSSSDNCLKSRQSLVPVFPWTSAASEKTFENVPVSLSHIVLSLILQAHCQRRLCAHPRGDGSPEGPGGHQPVTVRWQLPERRQPDP